MTWTVWDVLITVIGVLHIVGIVGMVVFALRILKGPVASAAGRVGDVAEKGRVVAESTLTTLNANRGHVESIVRDVQGIAAAVRPSEAMKNLPITYGSLRSNLATLTMLRQGVTAVRSFGKKTPPPGPLSTSSAKARPAHVSLPERLGLVPPVAKHLIRLAPYLRIAKTVLQQVKPRR